VVVGAGIAGLTAALSAARSGSRTLTLTGGIPGGILISIDRIDGMPGYPTGVPGYDLCPITEEQAADAGAEFSMAELQSLTPTDDGWTLVTSEGELTARTVIVATGAQLRTLGVPGEERLRGHGVSQCASCDAPLLRDKVAAVVGGGDSALQEALTLAESVARVTLLHRGEALTAQAAYTRELLEHPKIEISYLTVVDEVLGEERVNGLRTRQVTTGATADLDVDAVFAFVGLEPSTAFLGELLDLDSDGRVPVDSQMRTTLPGLLVAGTARSGTAGRAASAAGDGAVAALAARRYIDEGAWAERHVPTPA
jgi:thioredoxin reductase (NADPH)